MNNNYPCKCGHDLSLHLDRPTTDYQLKCFSEKDKGYNFCICAKFQGDNLKYIEDLTKEI